MLLRIAFRNVFRQRRRTLLTVLTMVGGFALASVSIAWQDGAYNDIINEFTRTRLGHIQIHQKDYRERPKLARNITRTGEIGAVLDGFERVEGWTPRVFSGGIASVGEKSAGMAITGIDPARENATTRFDERVVQGRPLARDGGHHEVLLGKGLATRLAAAPGDTLVVLSQGADGSLANDLYTIAGIVDSGDRMGDQSALYMHIADAQELLVLGERVHQVTIVADSPKKLFALADEIAAALDRTDVAVEPWQVFAKPFYEAMVADQQGNWISLFVIMMVVSVGVLNTVLMSVLERTREYGLMRAMGTRPRQVFSLVVVEVMVMACFSIVLGAAVALVANYLLSIYGISLPEEMSFAGFEFKDMHAEINLRSFLIPLVVVVFSALLVSLFPAARAARTAPAAAMRSV